MDHNLAQTSVSIRLNLRLQQSILTRYLIQRVWPIFQRTRLHMSWTLLSEAHPYQASVRVSRYLSANHGAAALRYSNLRVLRTLLTTSNTFLAQVRPITSSETLTLTIVLFRRDSISERLMTLTLAQHQQSRSFKCQALSLDTMRMIVAWSKLLTTAIW